jgi:PEP-CTERM motif
MVLSARRRTAVKRGAFAVAIAIVFAALIAAPQVFHTSTPPSAPASEIADVTETSPDAAADVAMTLPRPSGLSTAAVARAGHSLDALATVLGPDVDLFERPDLDLLLAQIPGTSDQDLFSGVDGLFAGCVSCVDQPIDVPEMQLARYYPLGPSAGGFAGGFAGGSRRGSGASGSAGVGGGPGLNANGNSSQLNPSSPAGNTGDGGNGNNKGGNGNNNSDQTNGTNTHRDEHSQGEIHSSSGDNPSVGPGGGPAGPSSNGSSEAPIRVPEPSTLLLAGFGLSGLMASRRLTHRAR